MRFDEITIPTGIQNFLVTAVRNNRMAHAMLFLGKTGHGPLAAAIALAQYVLCEKRSEHDSCGICNSCHKVSNLIHPDLHFTYPTIGAKATSNTFLPAWRSFLINGYYQDVQDWYEQQEGENNKQGNITKDECDRIMHILGMKTFEGSHKICIVWMAEYLGEMGNRLLKVMEEPTENTVFILIAENQELVLNTIISRCQLVPFPPLSDTQIVQYLETKSGLGWEDATQTAFLAKGNLKTALSLTGQSMEKVSDQWLEWLRICYKGYGLEIQTWVDQFMKLNRETQKAFMYFGLHFMREMLIFKVKAGYRVRLLPKEQTVLAKISELLRQELITGMIQLLEENIFHQERYINVRIMSFDSSIRMHYLLRDEQKKLEYILSR